MMQRVCRLRARLVLFLGVIALLVAVSGCESRRVGRAVALAAPAETLHSVAINRGESFRVALRRFGLDSVHHASISRLASTLGFENRTCGPAESLIGYYRDDRLCRVDYRQRYDRTYVLSLDSSCTKLSSIYHWVRTEPETHCGSIRSSLWMGMTDAGLKPDMIMSFADLFSWDVDFFSETQKGDSFKLILEQLYCDGRAIGRPRLQAGQYKGKCGDYYGFFYQDPTGHKDFFTRKGESVRKGFLRSPLQFSRISSFFSTGRYHPILRIVRPHQGIDYSARKGTPVSAIGDGVVTHCGWSGGYGNLVEISHGNGYKSRYGHLSRFGKIRGGGHVVQGQTIGYVGSTGMSTGPHLHFEVRVNGAARNPLKIIPPRATPVPAAYMAAFKARADSFIALLNLPGPRTDSSAAEAADSTPAPAAQDSVW